MGLVIEGGLQVADNGPEAEPAAVYCYPDNWLPLEVFRALGTQWHMNEKAVVRGLRYEVIPGVLDMLGVKRKGRADIFWALRVMEAEALTIFNRVPQHGR